MGQDNEWGMDMTGQDNEWGGSGHILVRLREYVWISLYGGNGHNAFPLERHPSGAHVTPD